MKEKKEESGFASFVEKAVNPRLPFITGAVIAIIVALACRYGLKGFLSKYLGVIFWATMVYTLMLIMNPYFQIRTALVSALVICWSVEFAQITPYPAFLSSKHIILRLIFGMSFSIWDLPSYLIGICIGAGTHALLRWRFNQHKVE